MGVGACGGVRMGEDAGATGSPRVKSDGRRPRDGGDIRMADGGASGGGAKAGDIGSDSGRRANKYFYS